MPRTSGVAERRGLRGKTCSFRTYSGFGSEWARIFKTQTEFIRKRSSTVQTFILPFLDCSQIPVLVAFFILHCVRVPDSIVFLLSYKCTGYGEVGWIDSLPCLLRASVLCRWLHNWLKAPRVAPTLHCGSNSNAVLPLNLRLTSTTLRDSPAASGTK